MACTANHVFHNWAETITCKPDQYCQPNEEQEVQQLGDKYEAFRKVRATLDPQGVFTNNFLRRLFD